jgi:UDP-glucose 4-epimerase
MHFCAASLVGESMEKPGVYFDNNVVGMIHLLQAMVDAGTPGIIFSSSAATYGEPERIPIPEEHPVRPTNPYGESKVISETLLSWFNRVHGVRYAALRYFNAAGAAERLGEDHTPETHLIPLALAAAAGTGDALPIFGRDYPTPDGTCVRDYIHVLDLADAHIRALERLGTLDEHAFNLGNGEGYSVLEVVKAFEAVSHLAIPYELRERRQGDVAMSIADVSEAERRLGWRATRSLTDMCRDSWTWLRSNPLGYGQLGTRAWSDLSESAQAVASWGT